MICSIRRPGSYGAQENIDFEQVIKTFRRKFNQLKTLSCLSPDINVMETPSPSTSQCLISAYRLLESITDEVQKRPAVGKNVVVFNISNRLPVEIVKSLILNACDMARQKFNCAGWRKKAATFWLPLLSNFPKSLRLNSLSKIVRLLLNTGFAKNKIFNHKTPPAKGGFSRSDTCISTATNPPTLPILSPIRDCKTTLPQICAALAIDLDLTISSSPTQTRLCNTLELTPLYKTT